MNPPIRRQILTEPATQTYLRNALAIGALAYQDLCVCIYTHPAHPHTRLINIEGYGHSLWMLYIYEAETDLIVDVDMFVKDFQEFVLFEREETHATKH